MGIESTSRADMMEELLNEHDDSQVVEQTSDSVETEAPDNSAILAELESHEGDITIAELRKLAEAAGEKHTDEELEAMWQAAQNPAPKATRSYKFYKDNNPVESLDGLTAEDILNLQFGYKAMGQEQRKSLDEIIRVAQFGHFNESRLAQLQNDRNSLYEKYTEASSKSQQFEQERQLWEYSLTQYVQGNSQPLEKLIEAFKNAQSAPPQFMQQQEQNPSTDYESQMAAQRVYYEQVVPQAMRLSQQYGANAQEIANVIVAIADQEAEFMSPERLEQIMTIELPYLLEQKGYSAGESVQQQAAPTDPRDAEIAELKRQLASSSAQQKNSAISAAKKRKAPPAGGGVVPSAGDTMPEIKDRNSMKEYLRN